MMPALAYFLRVCRKKSLLACLVVLAVLLLLGNIFYRSSYFTAEDSYVLHLRKLNQPFNWNLEDDPSPSNLTDETLLTCRNSVQGRTSLADDKGYLCPRSSLLNTGCCDTNSSLTERHVCRDCDRVLHCCSQFEVCISCCLRPEQVSSLQQILTKAEQTNNLLFVSVSDHFELCLAKCRTSSSSVQHENTYRDREKKFCYGPSPPPTSGL